MMDDIITKIEKLDPQAAEVILLSFNSDKISVEHAYPLYQQVKEAFPNNIVVGLPDFVKLESYSKEDLKNLISHITEITERL